ncbi:hypothetical protein VNI00_010364 [Paramarasmius palmivorus]|uniref:DUF6699 domain-containing protein n=1 Tax=Paramarasmius palmivorus TaxID=297713 RepID=A0AAW0CJF6_9AGAR
MQRAARHDHRFLAGTGRPYPHPDVDTDEETERNTALNATPRRRRRRKSSKKKSQKAPAVILHPALEGKGWGTAGEKLAYPDPSWARSFKNEPWKTDYSYRGWMNQQGFYTPQPAPPPYATCSGSVYNVPLPACSDLAPNPLHVNPVLGGTATRIFTPAPAPAPAFSDFAPNPLHVNPVLGGGIATRVFTPAPAPFPSRPNSVFVPVPPPSMNVAPAPQTSAVLAPPLPKPTCLKRLLPARSTPFDDIPKPVYGPPPPTYRPDFKCDKPSLLTKIWMDNGVSLSSIKLHPFLRYKSRYDYNISSDLRNPFWGTNLIRHDQHRDLSFADVHQLATEPTSRFMRLYHPLLPWYIDVSADDPSGITVKRVMETLVCDLSRVVLQSEVFNEKVTADERERIFVAQKGRCDGVMRRMDFLMNRSVFNGLERGKDGMWLIKTSRIDARR